ncbi:MAG: MFS transporter [Gammaproteobacteria bacterium]|nr:MFS transporter [Gammaproteobacteria bacterium]
MKSAVGSDLGGTENTPLNTSWLRVAILFAAGCTSSFHIGKIPGALPALTTELNLTLVSAAWLVSLFSVLSAVFGLLVSLVAGGSPRNAAVAGFTIAGLASLVGSGLHSAVALLISRSLEGVGWILIAITVPMLLATVSSVRDKPLVMGIWGAFLPVGMALSLWVSPAVLALSGWRMLWQLTGACSLLAGLVVWIIARRRVSSGARRWTWLEVRQTVLRPIPVLMFVCFFVYSAQFISLFSFLPTLLLEGYSIELALSAETVAIAIAFNVVGNVAAGWMLRRGSQASTLLLIAMIGCGVCAAIVFSQQFSLTVTVIAAIGFAATGGLVPGTLFALAQRVVARPALAGIVLGLITQAAGIGQLLGPPALATVVEWGGSWTHAILVTTLVSLSGAICARRLAGLEEQNN